MMYRGFVALSLFFMFAFSLNVQAEDGIDNLRQELAEESKELRDLVASFSSKLDSVKEPYRNELAKAETQINTKKKTIKALNDQIAVLEKRVKEKDETLVSLTETVSRCETNIGNIRTELTAANKKIRELSSAKAQVEIKESNARLTIERLEKNENILKKQFEENKAQILDDENKKQEKLGKEINKLSRELAVYQGKINDMLAQRVSAKRDFELANDKISDLEVQTAAAKAELEKVNKLNTQLRAKEDQLLDRVAELEAALQLKDKDLKSRKNLLAEKENLLEKNKSTIAALEKRIKDLELKLSNRDDMLKQSEAEKEELVAYFKAELDKRKKQIMQLLKQTK